VVVVRLQKQEKRVGKELATKSVAFNYGGVDVLFDDERLVSLTSMWEAAGKPANQSPYQWQRYAGAGFIADLAKTHKGGNAPFIKTRRGKGVAGTWAHWQVAMAYAKHLSHEFHRFVNEAFKEWAEERNNPDLKAARAVEGYRRQKWDDAKIIARLEGIVQRKAFTDTLKDHEVKGSGYAICTDAINTKVLGAPAKKLRAGKKLPASVATRDSLETHEMAALRFAEAMAVKRINDSNVRGNRACRDTCAFAGTVVRNSMDSISA